MVTKSSQQDALLQASVSKGTIKNFIVHVTAKDIARAKPNTQAWCMAALAIRSSIEDAHTVRVDSSFIRFSIGTPNEGGLRYAFPTPAKVAEAVRRYDEDAQANRPTTVKPFDFNLAAIQGYINPMVRRENRTPAPRSKNRNRPCYEKTRWNGQPLVLKKSRPAPPKSKRGCVEKERRATA